jgi:hypothetical protein
MFFSHHETILRIQRHTEGGDPAGMPLFPFERLWDTGWGDFPYLIRRLWEEKTHGSEGQTWSESPADITRWQSTSEN